MELSEGQRLRMHKNSTFLKGALPLGMLYTMSQSNLPVKSFYSSGELDFERYHALLQRNVIKDESDDIIPESTAEVLSSSQKE